MSLKRLTNVLNQVRQGAIKPPANSPLAALSKLVDAKLSGGDWDTTRKAGQRTRRAYTDRLQLDIGNNSEEYRSATNEVYKAVLGMDADRLRQSRKPHKGTDPAIARNYLTARELKAVQQTEATFANLPK